MANEALLDRLADAYQQAFSRVQIAAEQSAQDAWYSFDSFAGEDEDEWSEVFWEIVLGAALVASGLVVNYMRWQLDVEGIDVELPDPDLDWFEEDFDVWRLSPMVASRIGVAGAVDPREAMRLGATRVVEVTNAAIREAEQRSLNQIIESLGQIEVEVEFTEVEEGEPRRQKQRQKFAYRRIPQQGACGWCEVVADRLYTEKAKKNHPLGAWHDYCRCTWRKVTADEAAKFEPRLAGSAWKSVIDRRANVETGE